MSLLGRPLGSDVGLLADNDGRWQFELGDSNVPGWVTVALYALATVLAVRALRGATLATRELRDVDPIEAANQKKLARLWTLVAVSMILLGVNKQLDLQSLFIQTVRDRAVRDGWYDDRRGLQLLFILAIASVGTLATIAIAYALRRVLGRVKGVIAGLCLLLMFVLIRAASFHYLDRLLTLGTIRLNWILELGGLGLICVSIYWIPDTPRIDRPTSSSAPRTNRDDSLAGVAVDVGHDRDDR